MSADDANRPAISADPLTLADATDAYDALLQLAQSDRLASLGMLAGGVAHELGDPLSYVNGSLDLMSREIARALDGSPHEAFAALRSLDGLLRDARHGAERAKNITRGLELLSHVDPRAGKAVDVRRALEAAVDLAHGEIRRRARLVLDIAVVPAVWAEEGRLVHLALTLLWNAAHAIPDGAAPSNEIRLSARLDPSGWVRIEVADTGIGIPPEDLPRIFDPLFGSESITRDRGRGLGLSICHAMAVALGGRIDVTSERGRGSTFRLFLPASQPAQVVDARPLPAARPSEAGRRGNVLVVDDEPILVELFKTLVSQDHHVTMELRASVALKRFQRGERFDAIVCDLMMPEMTGMELHAQLMTLAPDQANAMIFLTGDAFSPQARAFLERVKNPSLEKPFDFEVLAERIRALVG